MAVNDFAVIGLDNIGQSLVINMKSRKYSVAIFDEDVEKAFGFSGECVSKVKAYRDLKGLVASLSAPRKIFLSLDGSKIDDVIAEILPNLNKSDALIDLSAGNYSDINNRAEDLTLKSIRYLEAAVTGPQEELSSGVGLIVGGREDAFSACSRILRQISKEHKGFSSCIHSGSWGTANYTKIIHDSIETSLMQIIADGYFMLRNLGGMKCEEVSSAFTFINEELDLYLLGITAKILEQIDVESGTPIIDYILDSASVADTEVAAFGEAFKNNIPNLLSSQAVFLRYLSGQREQRRMSVKKLYAPQIRYDSGSIKLLDSIKDAMKAAIIIAYAQGFDLLSAELKNGQWNYGEDEIARVWSGASTIRSNYLSRANTAYNKNDNLLNLMHDDYFTGQLKSAQKGIREIVMLSAKHSVPAPSFMSALSYYDCMRANVLPSNLIQSQLNYMKRDTVRRYDIQGNFNVDWIVGDSKQNKGNTSNH